MIRRLVLVLAVLLAGACAGSDGQGATAEESAAAGGQESAAAESGDAGGDGLEVALADAEGEDVGTVMLTESDGNVRIEGSLTGLAPGFHGFHVHDVGLCEPDAPDGPFTSAEGHYVGDGGTHGEHAGDMPSLLVTADGAAEIAFVTDAFELSELTGGDGAAVMVHEGQDNFANVPDRYVSEATGEPGPDDDTMSTGDAGSRAACGVVGGE